MQEKFRHYFHLLIAALFVVLLSFSMEVHAFDLLYGMLHGNQDTIVIGTIKEALDDGYLIQKEHVVFCSENTDHVPDYAPLPEQAIPDELTVSAFTYTYSYHQKKQPEVGDSVCLALNQEGDIWHPVNIHLELSCTDPDTLETTTLYNRKADPYALQLFLRSNGEMTDFTYSNGDLLVDGEVVFSDIENQKMLISQSDAESEEALPQDAENEDASLTNTAENDVSRTLLPEETVYSDTASVSIIGGADGPTAIFIAGKIGNFSVPAISIALLLIIIVMICIIKKKRG